MEQNPNNSKMNTAPALLALPATIKVNQQANKNGPDEQFQLNQNLLYEHEFPGHAFVSAHLQRLQHGVFAHENLHNDNTVHVTFAAITFTMHPAVSLSHRFVAATITVTAKSGANGKPIRFLKFAPHQAYGRISSATLKWNFQLGATVGVTKGPVNLSVNPSVSHEKDSVVGTMMKIQGSTRSTYNSQKRLPDTKLVWSLEENNQQETGLPREFTFVFLMERPVPAGFANNQKSFQSPTTELHPDTKQEHVVCQVVKIFEPSTPPPPNSSIDKTHNQDTHPLRQGSDMPVAKSTLELISSNNKQCLSPSASSHLREHLKEDLKEIKLFLGHDQTTSAIKLPGHEPDFISNIHAEIKELEQYPGSNQQPPFEYIGKIDDDTSSLDSDYQSVFTPVHFDILVEPMISGKRFEDLVFPADKIASVITGEVGQKFPTEAVNSGRNMQEELINGLYNFAKLPGAFEDLIELPGNAITSVEPTLPNPGGTSGAT